MALVPVAATLSSVTPTGFSIAVNADGNPGSTFYSFRVIFGATTKYVNSGGSLQDTKVFLNVTNQAVVNLIPNTLHSVALTAADDGAGLNESIVGPSAVEVTLAADPILSAFTNVFLIEEPRAKAFPGFSMMFLFTLSSIL